LDCLPCHTQGEKGRSAFSTLPFEVISSNPLLFSKLVLPSKSNTSSVSIGRISPSIITNISNTRSPNSISNPFLSKPLPVLDFTGRTSLSTVTSISYATFRNSISNLSSFNMSHYESTGGQSYDAIIQDNSHTDSQNDARGHKKRRGLEGPKMEPYWTWTCCHCHRGTNLSCHYDDFCTETYCRHSRCNDCELEKKWRPART